MPAKVPEPHAVPAHPLTSSSSLPNRVILFPAPIYRHKQLAAPPVAPTYSPHTNKGFRYDLAHVRCRNTPAYIERRLCSRILYSHTCASVITKHLDVTVTSPHHKCTCSASYAQAMSATPPLPLTPATPIHTSRYCSALSTWQLLALIKNFMTLTDS